ncbi:MAG: type IV pilus biogenesis/stability protein PilW [Betaproteobacteria bacterium]
MRRLYCIMLGLVAVVLAGCQSTTTVNGQPVATQQRSEPDPVKRAEIRLQLAASYYQNRQYQVAIEEAKRAIELDPKSAMSYSMLGLIYMDIDDRALAEQNFARALRIDGDDPEINNNYGWFLCRTGRERASIEYFERAAANRLYATPALAWRNAGFCTLQMKDYAAAEGYLRRAFELDATSPVTKFQLTRLYLATRQLDRANFYFGLLEREFGQTAEVAWLGLRLARAAGDGRGERQYADVIRSRYPSSPEASLLRRGAFDE